MSDDKAKSGSARERHSFRRVIGLLTGLGPEEKTTIRQAIDEAGGGSIRFWVLLVLSTVIASFGLITNSAAVIIGAMIIAPLMGPIIASALAIDAGDFRLLGKALVAEILGVAVAVFIGYLVGALPFDLGVSQEMLARTTPTLYDLFIAAACGFAGAYAMVDHKVSNALAGVAISVALVPPLAACGLFLSMGELTQASGAFMLFLANFLAIQICAGVVFFVYGIADIHELKGVTSKHLFRFAPSFVILVAVGVFMTSTLIQVAERRRFESNLNRVLAEEIGAQTGGQLDEVIIEGQKSDGFDVIAVALTPQPFDPAQVAAIEARLRKTCRPDINLIVRSLASSDADREGQVFLTQSQVGAILRQKEVETIVSRATEVLKRAMTEIPGASLVGLQRSETIGGMNVSAVVRTPVAITPNQVATMEQTLAEALEVRIRLTVRSVITREADATRYLYEATERAPISAPEEVARRLRIQSILDRKLARLEGAVLRELGIESNETALQVTAYVDAPSLLTPEMVAQYESDLRKYVDLKIKLTVRTTLVGSATSEGWQRSGRGPAG